MGQVHKRLTDDQVEELIERYLRKEIERRRSSTGTTTARSTLRLRKSSIAAS